MNPWDMSSQQPMGAAIQGAQTPSADSYPTFANSYGIGSGQPFAPAEAPAQAVPGTQSNPDYLEKPLNVTVPDSSSRGFNPWSLQGESNARG